MNLLPPQGNSKTFPYVFNEELFQPVQILFIFWIMHIIKGKLIAVPQACTTFVAQVMLIKLEKKETAYAYPEIFIIG